MSFFSRITSVYSTDSAEEKKPSTKTNPDNAPTTDHHESECDIFYARISEEAREDLKNASKNPAEFLKIFIQCCEEHIKKDTLESLKNTIEEYIKKLFEIQNSITEKQARVITHLVLEKRDITNWLKAYELIFQLHKKHINYYEENILLDTTYIKGLDKVMNKFEHLVVLLEKAKKCAVLPYIIPYQYSTSSNKLIKLICDNNDNKMHITSKKEFINEHMLAFDKDNNAWETIQELQTNFLECYIALSNTIGTDKAANFLEYTITNQSNEIISQALSQCKIICDEIDKIYEHQVKKELTNKIFAPNINFITKYAHYKYAIEIYKKIKKIDDQSEYQQQFDELLQMIDHPTYLNLSKEQKKQALNNSPKIILGCIKEFHETNQLLETGNGDDESISEIKRKIKDLQESTDAKTKAICAFLKLDTNAFTKYMLKEKPHVIDQETNERAYPILDLPKNFASYLEKIKIKCEVISQPSNDDDHYDDTYSIYDDTNRLYKVLTELCANMYRYEDERPYKYFLLLAYHMIFFNQETNIDGMQYIKNTIKECNPYVKKAENFIKDQEKNNNKSLLHSELLDVTKNFLETLLVPGIKTYESPKRIINRYEKSIPNRIKNYRARLLTGQKLTYFSEANKIQFVEEVLPILNAILPEPVSETKTNLAKIAEDIWNEIKQKAPTEKNCLVM